MPASTQRETPIVYADGTIAKGEKFHIWPDPTGRLGDARLWSHFYCFLSESEVFPSNWMQLIPTLNESQLVRAFAQQHPAFASMFARENWPLVLNAVRQALCAKSLNATMAFLVYPAEDAKALDLLNLLNRSAAGISAECLAIPEWA